MTTPSYPLARSTTPAQLKDARHVADAATLLAPGSRTRDPSHPCSRTAAPARLEGALRVAGVSPARPQHGAATAELTIAAQLLRRRRRSFSQTVETIGLQTRMSIDLPGRPANLDRFNTRGCAQPKVNARIVGGLIASSAVPLGHLPAPGGVNCDPSAHSITVGPWSLPVGT